MGTIVEKRGLPIVTIATVRGILPCAALRLPVFARFDPAVVTFLTGEHLHALCPFVAPSPSA